MKIRDYFDNYVEDKWLTDEKYYMDFNEFKYLDFETGLPEIYYDLIYYLSSYKFGEKEMKDPQYYKKVHKQIHHNRFGKFKYSNRNE